MKTIYRPFKLVLPEMTYELARDGLSLYTDGEDKCYQWKWVSYRARGVGKVRAMRRFRQHSLVGFRSIRDVKSAERLFLKATKIKRGGRLHYELVIPEGREKSIQMLLNLAVHTRFLTSRYSSGRKKASCREALYSRLARLRRYLNSRKKMHPLEQLALQAA